MARRRSYAPSRNHETDNASSFEMAREEARLRMRHPHSAVRSITRSGRKVEI